ncbi:MAG: flagellar hook-basal body complex protein [Lachnospiraceae bacterium]|nr:flagellar hook-basal body complex protein [Lachnospiraceae bacterium]
MMRSLFSAVSGLKTHQTKMDVIGNNVANVNTVAFKSSAVTFSEIMYQTVSGASGANATTGKGGVNAKQIGLGVTSGATKITITSSGTAETTGDGMDLRLTDKVTTNFFIVNDGTQNLFTRAGSFYIDGAGNLAMTSTGYTVMGWQVDETTGEIRKDTVSALRVMQEKNLTSAPEATTAGTVGGVMDKNDTNVTSDDGYVMTMNFFDKLGYSYTAKFAVKLINGDEGSYTVELTDILDSKNHSVLNDYTKGDQDRLATVFGKNTTASKSYAPTDSHVRYLKDGDVDPAYGFSGEGYYYSYSDYNATGEAITRYVKLDTLTFPNADDTYTIPSYTYYLTAEDAIADAQNPGSGNTFTTDAKTDNKVTELFGINLTQLGSFGSGDIPSLSIDEATGNLLYTEPAVNYNLQFNKTDGKFSYVDMQGSSSVVMHLADTLGDNFEDIEIDFSTCLTSDNGGKSTIGAEPGFDNGTVGKGKPLGVMIGLSIDSDGKIYGSYDNGNTVLLGQIAVAQFANASGLEKVGDNCYTTTLNSGDFDGIGVEIAADGSSMTSGELEMSNVDLSNEFTQMIITQRGFQSNSRVITVSDTLLEELINLKR